MTPRQQKLIAFRSLVQREGSRDECSLRRVGGFGIIFRQRWGDYMLRFLVSEICTNFIEGDDWILARMQKKKREKKSRPIKYAYVPFVCSVYRRVVKEEKIERNIVPTELRKNDPAKARDYSADKLAWNLKRGTDLVIVDVRAAEDYQKGHVPEGWIFVPVTGRSFGLANGLVPGARDHGVLPRDRILEHFA